MDVQVMRGGEGLELAEIRALVDAVSSHDGHAALGEHKWLDLVHGGRRDFAGLVARDEDHAHPLGYAHLSRHDDQWGLELVVHPSHRGAGVEVALVRRALEVASEEGGGHLHLWVFQPTDIHRDLARTLGLREGRDLLHMRVQLPVEVDAPLPGDVELRTFEPGRDEEAWLRVNNRAFDHHPEQGAWDRATLDRRMDEDWFDPETFLLAERDGDLTGFCWVKVTDGEGEIYVIGVDPDHQGGGLGRGLVAAGLSAMEARDLPVGTLYVDAANEAAVSMYRSLGFEADHVDRAYVTDL